MIEVAGDRLRVTAPMVIASAAAIRETGEAAILDRGASVVDLGAVTEADSSAVAVLLAWTRTAADRRQPLQIVDIPQSVRSLAALYGVTDLLPLHP